MIATNLPRHFALREFRIERMRTLRQPADDRVSFLGQTVVWMGAVLMATLVVAEICR